MSHKIDFFRDEVRNGFYIPTAIKQAWAETLDVLAEVDRICTKHGIRYYADWGSFLGAVRHGGFVPWDDDLDICMLRDDYDKFRAVADDELPEGFAIHDYERHENHWLFLARVINNKQMCFDDEYLEKHNNFPWMAGVDIFLKDYLYEDDEKEAQRDDEVMKIIAIADGIVNGELERMIAATQIEELKRKYNADLPEFKDDREMAVALYALAEKQMARVLPSDTGKIGQIFPWILKNGPKAGELKEDYEKIIRLPFEDTTIPVPAAYNKVLGQRYGNYNEIRKVWDGHEYPFFELQKETLEKMYGKEFPGFTFEEDMLRRIPADKKASLKTTAKDCTEEFYLQIADAENILKGGTLNEFVQILSDAQKLAADFGSLIEETLGVEAEVTKKMVDALQLFCDALWEEYQKIEAGENLTKLSLTRNALDIVSDAAHRLIINRREVLFLPIGPREWKGFDELYRKEKENADTDVYVVPLPLMTKDYYGQITMPEKDIEEAVNIADYPSDVWCFNWYLYDVSVHCPDVIYIQSPYDETNPVLTVPFDFYARNLRNYSDRIIYVPIDKTSEFGEKDETDQYNLKHYVTAPGVIYADKVLVQSENIKQQYVNALTAFAGKETESIWNNKITTEGFPSYTSSGKNSGKRMLYCIGANELIEKKKVFVSAVKNRLQILTEHKGDIATVVTFYPADRKEWEKIDKNASDEIFAEIERRAGLCDLKVVRFAPSQADDVAEDFNAYYGSPSPFVPAFVLKKKPVMLADYSISEEE